MAAWILKVSQVREASGKMARDAIVGAASELSVAQPVFQVSLKTRRELCHVS